MAEGGGEAMFNIGSDCALMLSYMWICVETSAYVPRKSSLITPLIRTIHEEQVWAVSCSLCDPFSVHQDLSQ